MREREGGGWRVEDVVVHEYVCGLVTRSIASELKCKTVKVIRGMYVIRPVLDVVGPTLTL